MNINWIEDFLIAAEGFNLKFSWVCSEHNVISFLNKVTVTLLLKHDDYDILKR